MFRVLCKFLLKLNFKNKSYRFIKIKKFRSLSEKVSKRQRVGIHGPVTGREGLEARRLGGERAEERSQSSTKGKAAYIF